MISSRDFQRIARQKLTTAEFLLENDYTLDAMYLGGYTLECTLKALIMELTPEPDRADRFEEISSGTKWHYSEVLRGFLKNKLGQQIPLELVRKFRRFPWSVSLRYELDRRDTGETRGFLKTARATYDWVEEHFS
jgi:HEPN domain-containing protein